ncbi:hypothetical protein [Nocardia inohanensis]|uniref:hypothetical protein n=1 Tax=Nocardia inohanensis TaxID=209246 RepID=UPI00083134BE|nr:hypothetical protein [Nocardia inohanensis]
MADEVAGAAGPAEAGWETVDAASHSGSIRVRTTPQGIPVALKVDPAELHRNPDELAGELLRLCQRAAARAGLALRKQLEESGMSAEALAHTGLPTEADVAQQELVEEQDYDTEPQSWLRTV